MCTCKFKVYSDKQIKQCGKYNIEQEQQSEPKLIPFNLEKALSGEPIMRRNGDIDFDFYYCKDSKDMPIITNRSGILFFHYENGTINVLGGHNDFDLFMAPKPKEIRYANLYEHSEDGEIFMQSKLYDNFEDAITGRLLHKYIKTISFEV